MKKTGKKSGALDKSEDKICAYVKCGKKFSTNRPNKIYHQQPCQFAAWSDTHPRTQAQLDTRLKEVLQIAIEALKDGATIEMRKSASEILQILL